MLFSSVACFGLRKMAPNDVLRCYVKFVSNLNLLRLTKPSSVLSSCKYSTSKTPLEENDNPVKFTETNASKISVYDNLQVGGRKNGPWFQPYVVAGCLTVFLLYFCILREENDIDDFLRGVAKNDNDYATYVDLQLKLSYCKKNKLDPGNLEQKIEELKTKLNIK